MTQNKDRKITIFICLLAVILGIVFKLAPNYYYWQGQNELKNKNFEKARQNLKHAYQLNKTNKNYRYYYALTLAKLKPTPDVQEELFLIAQTDNDSASLKASEKISEWRSNLLYNAGDNYIEQAPLDTGILRWDINKFPLKIIIEDESGLSLPPYYSTEILRAFSQWHASIDFIRFAMTSSVESANIIVKIAPPPANVCMETNCKYVVGYTTPDYAGSLLKKMTIILYSKDPFGNFFSDKELYNTILHEIGHALGIMGHSYSTEDLMYMSSGDNNFYAPYRSSFQYLSAKDINTIRLLYKLIPNITNTSLDELDTKGLVYAPIVLGTSTEISTRKLKEAINYIKNAPEIASGYIDLGIAYAELNKNKEAMKAMTKAYELSHTNSEKYISSYNLAVMYMNSGNLDKAAILAEEAKKINNSEELKELILNINYAKRGDKKPFKGNLMSIDKK